MATEDEIRDLEKRKLELEIQKLAKPFFSRLPFILAILPLLPSALGNIYQYGNLKTANTELADVNAEFDLAQERLDDTNASLDANKSILDNLRETIEEERAVLAVLHAAYNEEKSSLDEALQALENRVNQSKALELQVAEYESLIDTEGDAAQNERAREVKDKYDSIPKLDPIPQIFDRNIRARTPVLQIGGTQILVTPEVEKSLSPKLKESLVRNP